jgi:hypothetical protein
MKKIAALAVLLTLPVMGFAASGPTTVANEAGLTYNNKYPQNLQSFQTPQGSAKNISAQVTWSTTAFNTASFKDGSQSTGSITVTSTSSIVAASATDTITVPSTAAILGTNATNQITIVSTTGLAGLTGSITLIVANNAGVVASSPSIIINGQYFFTFGTNVTTGTTAAASATNLAAAITAAGIPFTAAVTASTGVTVACVSSGTFCNSYGINSTSATAVSSGSFSGGADPVNIQINNGVQTLKYIYGGNWASSDTVNDVATMLANVISTESSDKVIAAAISNVVYTTATVQGTLGNSFTATSSSSSRASVATSSFTNGAYPALQGASFTLNGQKFTNGPAWTDASGTSTNTCASIAASMSSGTLVTAVCAGNVVTLTAVTAGSAGNSIVLTSTGPNGALTIGTPTFINGQDNAIVTINGVTVTLGVDYNPPLVASTTANLATSIAAAINAKTSLSSILSANAAGSVVTATSTLNGVNTYALAVSTPSLTLSSNVFTGGSAPAMTLNSATIALPAHGFTKGLEVLFTSGTVTFGPLVNQTTYYAIVVDSNDIQLALTSTGAVAGLAIVVTSTNTQTSAHTYTLTPEPYTQGSAGGQWQVSNDGVNYINFTTTLNNVAVTSQTFSSVFPSSTVVQDFGQVDYGYLQYNVTAPSQGGLALKVILNAKD